MLNTILAAQLDIDMKRGDTTVFTLTFTDPNDSDNPYDLSVFTSLKMQARKGKDVGFELNLSDGLEVTGAENNILTISISAERATLYRDSYKYDIEGIGTSVTTILEGALRISGDVTT